MKIKLMGETWTVTMTVPEELLEFYETELNLKEIDGFHIQGHRIIFVNPDFGDCQHRRYVLMHEIIHALSNMTGLGLSEEQVDGLAFGFVRLIQDNPHLIDYLLGGAGDGGEYGDHA